MANVPLRQVQEWLGHSTITMTMRYAHLVPGSGAEFIHTLEDPVSRGNGVARAGGRIEEQKSSEQLGSDPSGIRTRVRGLKGHCPGPD
jgi:hypothetical protein